MTSTRQPAAGGFTLTGPLVAQAPLTAPPPSGEAASTGSLPQGGNRTGRSPGRRRIVVALGGNAMTGPDGRALPEAQRAAVELSMQGVAELLAAGHEVLVTHGNGPQVGNLLAQNELTKDEIPPVPLDWCVAETQATIGMLIVTALERVSAARGTQRQVAALITRVEVDPADPAWDRPTKPIGPYVDERAARAGTARGRRYQHGARGWRRVVPCPEPRALLDADLLRSLMELGVVVVAGGGGGIPMVREGDRLRGVEAVLDKDLTAVLLADAVGADCLVIATDVERVSTGFGTPSERPIGRIAPADLRTLAAAGHFASGSMGPKVEAAIRFTSYGPPASPGAPPGTAGEPVHRRRAVITSLARLADAASGEVGTVVEAVPASQVAPEGQVTTAGA